ncbi:hypothetical protein APS_0587 [Acetobacter pasteurianus subsp. pasteurianus LMG 1262 = NBRC 106471]|nr:hypothetical protein APS_0587 [Acetobacter pasteurianus subsp. pasteurianus LMG 1262 = NBRC 106471]
MSTGPTGVVAGVSAPGTAGWAAAGAAPLAAAPWWRGRAMASSA